MVEVALTAAVNEIVAKLAQARAERRAKLAKKFAKKFARSKKADEFAKIVAKAQAEHAERQAKHREQRVARGLTPEAGNGNPEPIIVLYETLDDDDFPYRRYLDRPSHEMIADRQRWYQDGVPMGGSRIGGLPDLPREIEWPTHQGKKLPFLAQINLSELAGPGNRLLPGDGWLYAFGLFDNDPGHDPDPVTMMIYRGPASSLVRVPRPDPGFVWPDWTGARIYQAVPVSSHRPVRPAGTKKPKKPSTAGWLFSEISRAWDGSAGEVADREFRDGDDWINLLAIHSVGSMQWSDAGDLFLVIRRSDLERGDFSNVLGAVYSS
jgi:hypothetical protein